MRRTSNRYRVLAAIVDHADGDEGCGYGTVDACLGWLSLAQKKRATAALRRMRLLTTKDLPTKKGRRVIAAAREIPF